MATATVGETVAVQEEWNPSSYASKEHLLRVVRDSVGTFFELVEALDNWEVPVTEHWQVRDLADRFRVMFFAI